MAREPVASYHLIPPWDEHERQCSQQVEHHSAWDEAHELGIYAEDGFSIQGPPGTESQPWSHEVAFRPLYKLMGRDCFITWKCNLEAYAIYVYTDTANDQLISFYEQHLGRLGFALIKAKPPTEFRKEES